MGSPMPAVGLYLTIGVVVVCHLLARRNLWKRIAERLPAPVLGFGYALVLALCLIFAPMTEKPFIYFQF
jgi:alginate O-acetyltransferase complex protein AlgI